MNLNRLSLGVVAVLTLAAGPFPSGVTRGTAPFVVTGNTGSVKPSSVSQNGYMSATQASDLVFVLSGGMASPVPTNPITWGSAGTTTGTGNVDTSGTIWGDTFTRADGLVAGTAPQFPYIGFSGGNFISSGGGVNWEVVSNQLRVLVGASGAMLWADSGHSDATLTVTVAALQSGSAPTLVFRSNAAASQFWMLQWFGGTYYLQKCTAPPPSLSCSVVASAATSLVSGDTISAVYAGSSITAKRNSTTVLSAVDATYSANTGSGVYSAIDATGATRFTNLRDVGSVDTRTISTVSGSYNFLIGQNARGFQRPGWYIGGPANQGGGEVQRAVVLDSSLSVSGTIKRSGLDVVVKIPFSGSGITFGSLPLLGQCIASSQTITIAGGTSGALDGCILNGATGEVTNTFKYTCRQLSPTTVDVSECCVAAPNCAGGTALSAFSGFVLQ